MKKKTIKKKVKKTKKSIKSKKSMKVYVLGSNRFLQEMLDLTKKLCELGVNGWIHPDYILYGKGEKLEDWNRAQAGEHVKVKQENDYMRSHYKNICSSDAIFIVNSEKDGMKNYIGPNVLIEMGQAYVNDKKIFLLNTIPTGVPHADEIETMEPVSLYGDLKNILKHI